MATDHLNVIERKLIDTLRSGTYNTTDGVGSGSAWASGSVIVFGQFPEPEDAKYPCIIVEMIAHGVEEQFMGQLISSGSSTAIGELYGVGFNLYCMVDRNSSMTVSTVAYKQRRLLNYLMLNCANVVMDCDFATTDTAVEERHYTGFRQMGYNPELEIWVAQTSMLIMFKYTR